MGLFQRGHGPKNPWSGGGGGGGAGGGEMGQIISERVSTLNTQAQKETKNSVTLLNKKLNTHPPPNYKGLHGSICHRDFAQIT
jgi:hypothetical protein